MCGIIGELANEEVDVNTFCRMRDELAHRGPDGAGLYTNDEQTVALGHRRLSIIDLSDAGSQPMCNEDETVWLTFNGEIYNFRELRDRLESLGHEFTSNTDSEVIVHGYEEWGVDCIERLRGMFAFGIWDENAERAVLARDRLGIKPLHYYDTGNRFVFASELKGIVADKSISRQINPTALKHYLLYRYIPAPLSIWQGINKIRPGHYLVREDGSTTTERYWDPSDSIDDCNPGEEKAVSEVGDLIREAVEYRLISDVSTGFLLSGGIDSSLITAYGSNQNDESTALSMGFDHEEQSELPYARTAADALDVKHEEEVLSSKDVSDLLDDVLYYYDEPLADTSVFPTFHLMDGVSRQLTVALSGDGGDELFVGYRWYTWYQYYRKLQPLSRVFEALSSVTNLLSDSFDHNLISKTDRICTPFNHDGLAQYRMIMNPRFTIPEINSLLGAELEDEMDHLNVLEQYADEEMDIKDVQLLDINSFLADDILVKVDRASMAHSVEVRVPFLDHKVVEYCLSLDTNLLFPNGEKKNLLKQVARQTLPSSIIDREKQGFGAPMDEMDFIGEYEHVLEDSQAVADGIFEQEALNRLRSGNTEWVKLYTLILFELWYRKWRPKNPS